MEKSKIIKIDVFKDKRGLFFELFNKRNLKKLNFKLDQANISQSKIGTIRGLHAQKKRYAQKKIIKVLQGKILDVVIDLREKSKAFGSISYYTLSDKDNYSLYVPKGYAHGFQALEEDTIIIYGCEGHYSFKNQFTLNPFDPFLNINWKKTKSTILSSKDWQSLNFNQLNMNNCLF